tara:strand:- start:321 stop:947 length:627 start_codon:yes stop_codon:yes gene_type:complete
MKATDKIVVSKVPIQDTRLFTKNYGNSQNLNKLLMNEITKMRDKDPKGLPSSNQGCWRSMHKYKCEVELFKPITMILASWTDHYFPNIPLDANVTYWTNVNEPGSTNIFHTHYMANADLSGVYYVQGGGTGVIRFATHEQLYRMIPSHMPHANMIGHDPYDGDILLFPSYLLHDVTPNPHPSRQRISIAFNATIKKKDTKGKSRGKTH